MRLLDMHNDAFVELTGYPEKNGNIVVENFEFLRRVIGIDFTSVLSHRKPITCADFTLEYGFLHFNDIKYLETFD
jgi:hypothetical protein